jgi:hypothetical protein
VCSSDLAGAFTAQPNAEAAVRLRSAPQSSVLLRGLSHDQVKKIGKTLVVMCLVLCHVRDLNLRRWQHVHKAARI